MAARPNGEPFIDLIFFGSHYCAMYRWDDVENWTILSEKGRGRKIFATATEARRETLRILIGRRKIRAEAIEVADPLGIESWRKEKAEAVTEERRRVFGDDKPLIVFPRKSKPVEVVRKKSRRTA